ncbi:MAG: plasmid mobilization relaxosome protein MobC [Candidatus Electrothrix sp. GM3_4]|nr:plasmid mobilization relaxosome protein MobC [Candidatus Electrothrix sp. GM3_4]
MNRKEYFKKYNQEKRKKLKDVHIYLTPEEYNFFERIAKKEGVKTTKIIKEMALSQAGKTFYLPQEKQEKLSEFVFLMRNLANNVNQIAKHSNTVKSLSAESENNLLSYLRELEDIVKNYVKKDSQ